LRDDNTGRYEYHQPIGRWDHIFDDKTRLYSMVTIQHGSEFRNNNGFPAPAQRGNIRSERTDQNYIFDFNRILSAQTVFDLRASFGRFTSNFPDGEDDFNFTYQDLGIQNMPTPPTVNRKTAPTIYLQNYPQDHRQLSFLEHAEPVGYFAELQPCARQANMALRFRMGADRARR
jgi:hypothetical protein